MFGKVKKMICKSYTKYMLRNVGHLGKKVLVHPRIWIIGGSNIQIGNDCFFGPGCRLEAWTKYNQKEFSPLLEIGDEVKVNSTCHIGAINKVIIGKQTLLGSHVTIIDHSHGCNSAEELIIHPSERDLFSKGPIIIGERCWICENVVILPNVSIGNECIIGANAVVTKDIPDRCVAVGNPAVVVRRITD